MATLYFSDINLCVDTSKDLNFLKKNYSKICRMKFSWKKLIINSKPLISELKDYVASGVSYKAKPGQHDDLVMSCLLMTRMMKVLADFDPKIFEKWTDRSSELTTPMPIFGNFYG